MVAAWLLHVAALPLISGPDFPEHLLAEARLAFPQAQRLEARSSPQGAYAVRDAAGQVLGHVLTTSPETDDLVGYAGPSNLLIALGTDGRVRRVKLLSSGDTQAHVDQVARAESFWRGLEGWVPASEPPPRVEAISGSTLTSLAMAEAVERRLLGKSLSLRFPQPVTLEEVGQLFPPAAAFEADNPRPGWHRVEDAQQRLLGFAVRTSPQSDNVRGYRGPTEALLAVAADGKELLAVRLRHSYDTPEYVDRVRDDEQFLNQLAAPTVAEWAQLDFAAAGIEGVSGATQTSYAVAEGIRRRLKGDQQADSDGRSWTQLLEPRDCGLLAVVMGSLLMGFTRLRTMKVVRTAWQIALVAGFGLWFGDLLSLALLAGWARHGVPWQTAPVLVLLAVLALTVPWTTQRQLYCQQLCPHGAVQEWLGRFRPLHLPLRPHWQLWLRRLPSVLLLVAFALGIMALSFDLSVLEPFDAWVLKGAAIASAIIAVSGLIVSAFVPQAYCRFGCPTGALLKYIRSGGAHDRFRRRDAAAAASLVVAAMFVFLRPFLDDRSETAPATQPTVGGELKGKAFGTTWTVKVRGNAPGRDALQERLAAELERIESTLSHWRATSATSQFNSSETTFEMDQPPDLIALVAHALRLSRATDGAFDITVAPLVSAWGYGPDSTPGMIPDDAQITALLERVGWQKLEVDVQANTLRKTHPLLQIDLGALLQGHAVDRLAGLLDSMAVSEYLIEIGGELRARGTWTVAVEDPSNLGQPLRIVELSNAALATSGTYRTQPAADREPSHHLISPTTGRPVTAVVRLCAVVRPTCLEADGWATALLMAGLPQAINIADGHDLPALFVDQQGQILTSAAGITVFEPPLAGDA